MRYSDDTVLDFISDRIQAKLSYTDVEVSDYDEDVGIIVIIDRKNAYKLKIDFVKSIVLFYNEKGKLIWSNDTLDLVDDIEDTSSFIANIVARFIEKEDKMNLGEAKEILNKNGYLLEDVEWLPGTGTGASTIAGYMRSYWDGIGSMDLFRGGKPTKTFQILNYLYSEAEQGEISSKEFCEMFFNGNHDNMRTWLSKNPDYILSAKIGNKRFYKISKNGIKTIKKALETLEDEEV